MSRILTEEELKALTDDLQEVLTKHNAEMGVTSSINLMKADEVIEDEDEENNTDTETDKVSK